MSGVLCLGFGKGKVSFIKYVLDNNISHKWNMKLDKLPLNARKPLNEFNDIKLPLN